MSTTKVIWDEQEPQIIKQVLARVQGYFSKFYFTGERWGEKGKSHQQSEKSNFQILYVSSLTYL